MGVPALRRQDYGDEAIADWARKIRAQPWEEAYAFLKHEDSGTARGWRRRWRRDSRARLSG
jgi:hypothetical protein